MNPERNLISPSPLALQASFQMAPWVPFAVARSRATALKDERGWGKVVGSSGVIRRDGTSKEVSAACPDLGV